MSKHEETLYANKGYKLSLLYQLCRFQNRNSWYTFQTLFAQKRGLAHSYFLCELL